METAHLSAEAPGAIETAARILVGGGLVAFPTETVYGLGADATNGEAVARIYAAKGRPTFNPLIVHVADADEARTIGRISGDAALLADALWPGPLTLVVPLRSDAGIAALVTAGLETVALRVPGRSLARELVRSAGCPVAAPSANPSGRISPTLAEHVASGLDGKIDAILDGGPADVGVESTIIGFGDGPTLLRPGGASRAVIEEVLGRKLHERSGDGHITRPDSPGQLLSHYAPRASVRLNADTARPGEVLLGFGPDATDARLNLSAKGDLVEAAANLFAHLHTLDALGAPIAVSPIPKEGLGEGINDRLRRAAAPR